MLCLRSSRIIFNSLKVPSLRSLHFKFCFSRSISPAERSSWSPCRAFSESVKAHSLDDLFNYTSGRWIINDALRHAERRFVFNVDGLCRLAAQSVDQSPADIVSFSKLAEGGFNRTFLVTMRDGFQMVARIPYPVTVPKYYAVASEVATMALLRSSGLPTPKIYGYSPEVENAAETEYIFMEFVRGTKLSDVWQELDEREIFSVLRQLVQLESKMMSISFPAGGSLYFTQDLEKVGVAGVPLDDNRFCVGPETRLKLWYGRRSRLSVDRGPYSSAEEVLVKAAHKELAYLERFGQPLLPFERAKRYCYEYQKQSPLDHIENLNRYLLIAPLLVPRNPTLSHFRLRHPDLQQSNIIVSESPESEWKVTGLLDWQHASILPVFLFAGIPQSLQNYDDPVSQALTRPLLPENFNELDETKQNQELELYRSRIVHYIYVMNTKDYNELHHTALTSPMGVLRRRLFHHASNPWEGETTALKIALIEATEKWEALTGGGAGPCPVVFDAGDVLETMKLDEKLNEVDVALEAFRNNIGHGLDGWVPNEHYEEAMARTQRMKEVALAEATEEKERAELLGHWFYDDMDEEEYM